MLKRLTAMLLAVLLTLSVTTAFAWTCPNCGAEMDSKFCAECGAKKPENICPGCGVNHGEKQLKFCTECGTKMDGAAAPTAAPTAEPTAAPAQGPVIEGVFVNENGTVSIMWDADGTTKYTIECVQRLSDDPWADRAAKNGFYTSQSKYNIGFYTINKLIPGQQYWIGVFDAQGNGEFVAYDPQEPAAFSEFPLGLEAKLMVEENGVQSEVEYLTASAIEMGTKYGLYLAMPYENSGEAREYLTQIVLKASDGSRWVMAGQANFSANTSNVTGWKFLSLKDYFDRMQECFGTVFMGNYSVSVYVNGALVGGQGFCVEQKEAAQATAVPAAAPTAAPTAEVAGIEWINVNDNGTGSATVTWGGGTPPYRVKYMQKCSDDFNADQDAPDSFGQWIADDSLTETSYVLNRLVPGREYWVSVFDANGKGRYIEYSSPDHGMLTGYGITLELVPRQQVDEAKTNLGAIPADKAGLTDDDVSYGAYLVVNYDNPGDDLPVFLQVALTLPNGAYRVEKYADATLRSGKNNLGWSFCDLEWYFGQVRKNFGSIPLGDIQVDVYLNGKLAASGTVPVREQQPLTITGCTRLTNGHVRVMWKDNGSGPYTVYYHERFTDNVEADRSDDRGSGRWIAEDECAQTSFDIRHLIPGKDYWITVKDSMGTQAEYAYSGAAVNTSDLNMRAEASYVARVGEEISALSGFSAAEILQSEDIEYGMEINLYYKELSAQTKKTAQWVMTMPNGVSFCEYAFDVNLYADGQTYWECYTLDWAFDNVIRLYDELLTGQYTMTLYVMGERACSFTFTMGE